MEFDLERLFSDLREGELFPQFSDTWSDRFSEAEAIVDAVCESGGSERVSIALDLENPEAFCSCFSALGNLDLDLAFFNPSWTDNERELALDVAKPSWSIRDDGRGGFVAEKRSSRIGQEEGVTRGPRFLIPTGGSSGAIRFAMHRWETLLAATGGLIEHMGANRISSCCMLPLFHVSGFMQLARTAATQGRIVFGTTREFLSLHKTLCEYDDGERYLSLVSTQLERLSKGAETLEAMRCYRAIYVGGGPIAVGQIEAARKAGLRLAPTYGMTETAAQIATLEHSAFLEGGVGQGRPLPHAQLSILDETGSEVDPGTIGRIEIRSSSLFRGYMGEQERTIERFCPPDRGLIDKDGNLTVLGRIDRVIVSGGEKIDLEEIELALSRSGLVDECLAFGIEDSEWGERLAVAFVSNSSEATEKAVSEALGEKLARYKLPKVWLKVDSLPRNEAGKVRVGCLREEVGKRF